MNGDLHCREVFINGDCVSGIFSTPCKKDIDAVFEVAGKLNSVTQILNWRLEQKKYTTFQVGIGMAYGRALMLKAGYKGSSINDVIWMGDVVNEASNLCHEGSRGIRSTLQVSRVVQENLNDEYKKLLKSVFKNSAYLIDQYEGEVINSAMNEYLVELKKKAEKAKRGW